MTARNDITGDVIATKGTSSAFRDGWDRIFGKKEQKSQPVLQVVDAPKDPWLQRRDELRLKWYDFNEANQRTIDQFPTFREFVAQHHPDEFDFIFSDDRNRESS